MGIVKFDDPYVARNLLPNYFDKGVNVIIESGGKRIKADIAEERSKGARKYCEFHAEESHDIQECTEFKTTVQNLMDNKEMEFYEEIKGSKEGEVYA
ncbi:hypothetical protein PVK06_009247 [Gossypium arboreum]|uniref:Uncharacterized protein n=1 Tax=Gossypium arboreum TaxID=29729 RepID=A0ABR0QNC4_GOSAR|nr:hypothetical protein PVK06_009247 [Gossypium arboreum]